MSTSNLPTLKDCAILVSVNGGKPKMTQKDKTATAVAEDELNARDAGSFVKRLWPKHLMQPVITAELAVRNTVKMFGIPFARNLTLIPNSLRLRLEEALAAPLKQHEMAVDALFMNYDNVINVARAQLGDMFDASVYPSASALKSQFHISVLPMPAPDTAGLAIDEFGKTLQQRAEVHTMNILKEGTQSCFEQLADTVSNLADKLKRKIEMETSADPTLNKRSMPRFHDSLQQDLEHLLDVLPELNFTHDPALDAIVQDAKMKLRINTEVLKNGAISVKEQILADAESILARMQGMY
jgi:hypothetical protein